MVIRHRIPILISALLVLTAGFVIRPPSRVSAASSLQYQVVDADQAHDGGVYYRNSPHWNDTNRITGVGGYYGETVQLICYAWGDPVGPYQNTLWHYVTNISRPTAGEGYLPDHYLNTPLSANLPAPMLGEPECGSVTLPTSVFFSGGTDAHGGSGHQVATQDIDPQTLSQPNCSSAVVGKVISGVSTLAGWSRGRVGVIFTLATYAATDPAKYNAVHRIVLIDPGSSSDIEGGCDANYDVNSLLANWLSRSGNQLLILTGRSTEEKPFNGSSVTQYLPSSFSGLKKYYLAGILNQPFANRLLVCDYNMANHEQIMKDAWGVVQFPPDGCPILSHEALPVSWN